MARATFIDRIFDGRIDDRAHGVHAFEQHIAEVKCALPAERLLVFDVEQGWTPLCSADADALAASRERRSSRSPSRQLKNSSPKKPGFVPAPPPCLYGSASSGCCAYCRDSRD